MPSSALLFSLTQMPVSLVVLPPPNGIFSTPLDDCSSSLVSSFSSYITRTQSPFSPSSTGLFRAHTNISADAAAAADEDEACDETKPSACCVVLVTVVFDVVVAGVEERAVAARTCRGLLLDRFDRCCC